MEWWNIGGEMEWLRKKRLFCRWLHATERNATNEYPENNKNHYLSILQYSMIPASKHSIIPSFQHSIIPSFQHSIIPAFQHSIIPMFHGGSHGFTIW